MTKVFIDGSAGTTGLRIYERLSERKDLDLIILSEENRKVLECRRDAINRADIAFLCLPDPAAIEAVGLLENPDTAVIDTSTAHRTSDDWTYGFPELTGLREKIKTSKRIANPGCHASGVIALVRPLVENGILNKNAELSAVSITGYSGGGKKMIAEYEENQTNELLKAPRMYGIAQKHKHLPEIAKICNLEHSPVFLPIVAPFYAGMEVTIGVQKGQINGDFGTIKALYGDYYSTGLVRFCENADEDGFLSAAAFAGRDDMQITVCGNDDRILLVARFDNLGKGASGAAIQNMNLLMGVEESTGLNV